MVRLRTIVGSLVAACLGWAGGCSRAPADAVHPPAAEAEPQVLRIAFVPQVDMEERYDAAYRALEAYLAPALGLKVEVVQVESVNVANVVAIRRELPEAFKARVRDALVRMADAAPELWAVVARQFSNPVSRYLPADDAHFARFRDAVEHVPGLQIAL